MIVSRGVTIVKTSEIVADKGSASILNSSSSRNNYTDILVGRCFIYCIDNSTVHCHLIIIIVFKISMI